MRITTRGQLAVSAMTDLAMRQNTGPVALSTISARQGTSLSYLEQLFSALKRAGLVDSTRGPGGGYALAHKPEQVSVADIVVAVENHKPGEEAAPASNGSSQMVTMTGSLFTAFNARVLEYLQSVTLRDLVASNRRVAYGSSHRWWPVQKLARRPAPLMARAGVPNSVFALGALPVLARK
jgi:Rrf2 family iron-sulfur cluster assembly transcriptional regulator